MKEKSFKVEFMKYKGDSKELETFLSTKGFEAEYNKGNIDIAFTSRDGTIINWFKSSGTLSFQGSSNEKIKQEVTNFITGTVVDIYSNESISENASKVYIVHGHDLTAKEQLENILFRWGLTPVATMDQATSGGTIIETLLRDLKICDYGIVILTPDDIGYSKKDGPESSRPRARQNVILELGILMGSLGRERVLVARKSDIEEPSDIHGVLYKAFNENIKEITEELRKEFKASNIKIKD